MNSPSPLSSSPSPWIAWWLFAVSAAAFTALWMILPLTEYDGRIYMELARNIPRTGYEVFGETHSKFLPLYPALMALGDWLTGFRLGPETWGHLVSSLSGAVLTVLLYLLSLRMGASRRSATAVALLHLVMAAALNEYRDVSVVPLFSALLGGALLLFIRQKWFTFGLVLGLAAITRYETYLLLPLVILVEFRRPSHLGRAALGMALAAGFWWGRNLIYFSQPLESHYFEEVLFLQFHLFQIIGDLIIQFGPFVLLAAAWGFRLQENKLKVILVGFGALYLIVHVFWWWYSWRFLPPFAVLLLPPAARGFDRLREWGERRGAKVSYRALAIALAAIWMTTSSGVAIYRGATAIPEPYIEAAISLRNVPQDAAILGYIPFYLNSYARHQSYQWRVIKPGEDPHQFIYRYYRYYGVRYLVWGSAYDVDRIYFSFLDGRPITEQTIETPAGKFRLTYLFVRSFFTPRNIVNIYEIKVAGPLEDHPASPSGP